MATERIRYWTVEKYLAHEAESEIKHEYIDGGIYAVTGGTFNHSLITANALVAIGSQLHNSDCSPLSSDMRVKVGEARYVYPDLSVVCGTAIFDDDDSTILLNPILIAEVTSPSSIDYDRVIKREYYRAVASIQAYLVIDQHRVLAELYTRTQMGWLLQHFSNLDDKVPLEMLACTLPLAQVYRGITFDKAAPLP